MIVVVVVVVIVTNLCDSFREADLRAEQLGKKAVRLQQEVKEWDTKNKDLEAKHQGVKDELDEMERQLEGV